MIGISTISMRGLSSDLGEFFTTSTKMGFEGFECHNSSAGVSRRDVVYWRSRLNPRIVSVHNIFVDVPFTPENTGGDFLSSLSESEREEGIRLTLETARFARESGARAVVLHAGFIREKSLRNRYRAMRADWARDKDSSNFETSRKDLYMMRAKFAPDYVESCIMSLKETCRSNRDILFCLEPRVNFYEIPNLEEMKQIFNRVKEDNLRYWHDTGHCQIQEKLGLNRQQDWFKAFGERMVGIHLHDTVLLEDHLPPGVGDVDFSFIQKQIGKETIKILEVSARTTKEELEKSLIFLKRTGLA